MKKRIIFISVVLAVCLACGALYTVWAYNNPKFSIVKSKPVEANPDYYVESFVIADAARLKWVKSYPEKVSEKANDMAETIAEKLEEIHKTYTAPMHISANCEVKDSTTIITYSGTATNKSDGKTVDVNDQLVFDYILTKDISND